MKSPEEVHEECEADDLATQCPTLMKILQRMYERPVPGAVHRPMLPKWVLYEICDGDLEAKQKILLAEQELSQKIVSGADCEAASFGTTIACPIGYPVDHFQYLINHQNLLDLSSQTMTQLNLVYDWMYI